MIYPFKLNAPPHEIAFVSDMHYGHDRDFIWGPRGFKSVTEHDETLVHRWNEVCTPRTHVIHLGDLCFADPEGNRFWSLMRRLQFRTLSTLWGNHNSGAKTVYTRALLEQYPNVAANGAEVYPLIVPVDGDPNKQVIFLPEYLETTIHGQRIVMCHYAIASHHKAGHGSWMLAGHSHGSLPMTNKVTGVGKRLDLGIESFGRPITFAEVKAFMDKREAVSFDHHGAETT